MNGNDVIKREQEQTTDEGNELAPFTNTYAQLPNPFFARVLPTPAPDPHLIAFNAALAVELGLDTSTLNTQTLTAIFSGNLIPRGAAPIAMAYAGHQFANFVPQLGDGRAILLGEVVDRNGRRRDIQLKGAGRTPFSRRGDGRAALGPVLREYVVSEAMHALGISTTRALAAVTTGETVHREGMPPGAIVTRVAASHIRIGTFQYFAARNDEHSLKRLADYVIERHAQQRPKLIDSTRPYLALLQTVADRQASLIANWMQVGFIHGVMNTDNMTVSGETIDYGPCAFMDAYDPATVFSAIDQHGRYAYANQPRIAQWNLARFAETLLPLIDPNPTLAIEHATQVITEFPARYIEHWLAGMRHKLGLVTAHDTDLPLVQDLLSTMHANGADFTNTFRSLCNAAKDPDANHDLRAHFADPNAFDEWATRWRARCNMDPQDATTRATAMRQINPAVIPRNHQIERAIVAAVDRGDFDPFNTLIKVLAQPYDDVPEYIAYTTPPQPNERVTQTFCGT
jgi:serine/tyrosine/threonine adenylyltransferase